MNKTIAISGGFDPVHVGHLNMIKDAAKYGSVIVILNSDEWLVRKKGYAFMTFEERKAILEAFADVHHVVSVDDSDGTVCDALDRLRPCYFGNGGDRKKNNSPEEAYCKWRKIKTVYSVGGKKTQSSSRLLKDSKEKEQENESV